MFWSLVCLEDSFLKVILFSDFLKSKNKQLEMRKPTKWYRHWKSTENLLIYVAFLLLTKKKTHKKQASQGLNEQQNQPDGKTMYSEVGLDKYQLF